MNALELFWKAENHSAEENSRWCQLRAIEWGKFPLFAAQPFVPILFMFFEWWHIILSVSLFTFLWFFFRYLFVSVRLSEITVFLVKLKWPISIIFGIIYFLEKQYIIAGLSIFWPILTMILLMLTGPTKIGKIEKLFSKKIGIG